MNRRDAAAATVALTVLAVFVACFSEQGMGPQPVGVTCERASQPPGPDTAFVVISGFAFSPVETRVAPGVRVVWINCEAPETPGHTTTATDGGWDSPTLAPGDVFSVIPAAGIHDYHCRPHPFMQGRVVVE